MKRIIIAILIGLLVPPPAVFGANCGGVVPCVCGDTVTSDYTLAGDLACTNAGNALNVGANNITIDLAGRTISGDDTNTVVGIDNNGFTGITILNGIIRDTTTSGTDMRGASTGVISDVTCTSTGNQGFQNQGTANFVYTNIVGTDNVDDGFSMHDDSVATIITGTFSGNDQGINIIANSNLTGSNIVLSGNTTTSFYPTASTGGLTASLDTLSADTPVNLDAGVVTITGLTSTEGGVQIGTATVTIVDFAITATTARALDQVGAATSQLSRGTITGAVDTNGAVIGCAAGTLHLSQIDATGSAAGRQSILVTGGTLTAD
ncbi:MAG: hypothetical protein C4576_11350, partial [Desulfobacteraceae bacterium]